MKRKYYRRRFQKASGGYVNGGDVMYEEDIKKINEWFDKEDEDRSYHTYRSDTEYSVDASDMEDFTDFFRENFPDYVGIECMVGSDGIWFWESSLERAESY